MPALLKGHCAVFLDNNTLMVIGGYRFPISYADTYMLDISTNSWSSGPSLTTVRSYHTCNLVTNCAGKKQVVVVGGVTTGVTDYTNSVEIYDVDSETWSAGNYVFYFICWIIKSENLFVLGNDYPFEVYEHGSAYYNDSFVVIGGYTSDATAINSIYL